MQQTLTIILVLCLMGCAIEEAKPSEKQQLVIASDYLSPSDTVLFSDFIKKSGIQIRILTLSPEKIKSHIERFKNNAQFDLVMLGKLSSVLTLENVKFHNLSNAYLSKYANSLKIFHNRQWIVSSLDPYFFSFERDSSAIPELYDQLGSGFMWASPDKDKWDLFDVYFTYYLSGLKEENSKRIKEQFSLNEVEFFQSNDSVRNQQFLLHKNSSYLSSKTLFSNKKRELSKSTNIRGFGVYADRKCMAIVNEAKNIGNASEFLSYWDEHYSRENFLPTQGDYPYPDKRGISKGVKFFIISEDELLALLKKQNFKKN